MLASSRPAGPGRARRTSGASVEGMNSWRTIAVSVIVVASPSKVFPILSNPLGYLPPSRCTCWTKARGAGGGSRWEEQHAILGIPYRTEFEIVEFVPDSGRMALEIKSFLAAHQERTATATPEGTNVTIRVRYRVPGGPLGLLLDRLGFEPHGRWAFARSLSASSASRRRASRRAERPMAQPDRPSCARCLRFTIFWF